MRNEQKQRQIRNEQKQKQRQMRNEQKQKTKPIKKIEKIFKLKENKNKNVNDKDFNLDDLV